jgi:prefoldin subunit 5
MTTEPYEESVHAAVAREAARRKRVLLAFLGLLLLPIAIGAWALTRAKTSVETVVAEVAPRVTESVGTEIATRVTNDVVARTEPLIKQNVSREVTTAIEPRIASATSTLRGDIAKLQTTVQETSQLVARVSPQLAALPELQTRVVSFDADQQRLRQEMARREITVNEIRQNANANNEALAAINRRLGALDSELKKLEGRVAALERGRTLR